eukprot:10244655-Alexandrium_andersonii.AAC.1
MHVLIVKARTCPKRGWGAPIPGAQHPGRKARGQLPQLGRECPTEEARRARVEVHEVSPEAPRGLAARG